MGHSLDLERLAFLTEICSGPGSPASIGLLVETFIADGDQRVAGMENRLRAGDLRGLADLAHDLKGSSASVGAVALSAAAALLHRGALDALAASSEQPAPTGALRPLVDLATAELQRANVALRSAVPAGCEAP